MREVRGRHKTYISKVIQHPSNVVEIQIKKENTKSRAGQVCFCPTVIADHGCNNSLSSTVHLPVLSGCFGFPIPPVHTYECTGRRLHLGPRSRRRRLHESPRKGLGM
jgi:hypothetical protein